MQISWYVLFGAKWESVVSVHLKLKSFNKYLGNRPDSFSKQTIFDIVQNIFLVGVWYRLHSNLYVNRRIAVRRILPLSRIFGWISESGSRTRFLRWRISLFSNSSISIHSSILATSFFLSMNEKVLHWLEITTAMSNGRRFGRIRSVEGEAHGRKPTYIVERWSSLSISFLSSLDR